MSVGLGPDEAGDVRARLLDGGVGLLAEGMLAAGRVPELLRQERQHRRHHRRVHGRRGVVVEVDRARHDLILSDSRRPA